MPNSIIIAVLIVCLIVNLICMTVGIIRKKLPLALWCFFAAVVTGFYLGWWVG